MVSLNFCPLVCHTLLPTINFYLPPPRAWWAKVRNLRHNIELQPKPAKMRPNIENAKKIQLNPDFNVFLDLINLKSLCDYLPLIIPLFNKIPI